MINQQSVLFAIYKNGEHIGNQRGINESDAIKNYIIQARFKNLLDDKKFVSKYSAIIAIEKTHYIKSKYINL